MMWNVEKKEMRMNGNRNTMHKGYWQKKKKKTRREKKQKKNIKARNRSERKEKKYYTLSDIVEKGIPRRHQLVYQSNITGR